MTISKSSFASFPSLQITTYDILKSLAVIIMVIDHLGFYFYADENWFRAVGRIGFPVWFFLIGYARTRTIDKWLIGGALVLIAADALVGRQTFPLNALVTMTLLRIGIDPIMRFVGRSDIKLVAVTALAYLLFPITTAFFEYGTLAFIFAFAGYLARHNFQDQVLIPRFYAFMAVFIFVVTQHEVFQFNLAQDIFNALGSTLMMAALLFYLPKKEKIGFRIDNRAVQHALRFMGNRTLEIYVVHLTLFKIVFLFMCHCSTCCCHPFRIAFHGWFS